MLKVLFNKTIFFSKPIAACKANVTEVTTTSDKLNKPIKSKCENVPKYFAFDFFDNQKTIHERIIASDKTVLVARRELLEDTKILNDSAFRNQVKLIWVSEHERHSGINKERL